MKNWSKRLEEIKKTIGASGTDYKRVLLGRVDRALKGMTKDQQKTLSESLHLKRQKTKAERDVYRAIAFLEKLFCEDPRSVTQVFTDLKNLELYRVNSALNRLIKTLDPANPNPPDLARHRPLLIGCSISGGNHPGPGSIGCFVLCNETNRPMILGNEHVMRAESGINTEGNPAIFQPSKGNGATDRDHVATYARGFLDARVDAAVAYLNEGVQYANRTPEGVTILGTAVEHGIGLNVWKRGTASRRTDGRIEDDRANKSVPHGRFGGTIHFANQIEVKVTGPKKDFQIPGDSGATLINDQNYIVGLMHGGGMDGGGIATPIARVFELLNVRFPD